MLPPFNGSMQTLFGVQLMLRLVDVTSRGVQWACYELWLSAVWGEV